jgi:hypothetical protein
MAEEMNVDPLAAGKEDVVTQNLKRSFREILDSYANDSPEAKRANFREFLENFAKTTTPTPAKQQEAGLSRTNIFRVEVSKVTFRVTNSKLSNHDISQLGLS